MAETPTRLVTADQLLRMPDDGKRHELRSPSDTADDVGEKVAD